MQIFGFGSIWVIEFFGIIDLVCFSVRYLYGSGEFQFFQVFFFPPVDLLRRVLWAVLVYGIRFGDECFTFGWSPGVFVWQHITPRQGIQHYSCCKTTSTIYVCK